MEKFIIGIAIIIIIFTFGFIFVTIQNNANYGTKEGTVIDKQYNGSFTTYVYSGKVLVPIYHPSSWKIKLQKETVDGEKTIWIDVTEEEYKTINIGDYLGNKEK